MLVEPVSEDAAYLTLPNIVPQEATTARGVLPNRARIQHKGKMKREIAQREARGRARLAERPGRENPNARFNRDEG